MLHLINDQQGPLQDYLEFSLTTKQLLLAIVTQFDFYVTDSYNHLFTTTLGLNLYALLIT